MRFLLNILTVVLVAAAAGVGALWARSYHAADVVESYQDVPPPPLGQTKPWGQRDRWREASVKSYPGRFEVVWTETKIKGRRRGPAHDEGQLPGPVVNGVTLTQYPEPGRLTGDRAKPTSLSSIKSPAAIRESIGSWDLDYIRPVKLKQADYQEIRQVKGHGYSVPYWMVVAGLGAVPAFRLLNAFFRVGRAPVDSLGRRQEGAGLRGMLAGTGRVLSAASLLLMAATGAVWGVSRAVTLRLEGQPAGRSDFRTVVASRVGVLVKASPTDTASGGSSVARYRLTYDVPSAVVAPSDRYPGRVIVNRLGLYAAEGDVTAVAETASEAEAENEQGVATESESEDGSENEAEDAADPETQTVTQPADNSATGEEAPADPPRAGPAVAAADPDDDDVPPSSWLATKDIDEAAGYRWVTFVPYWLACVAFALVPGAHLWLRVRPPRTDKGSRFGGVMGVLGTNSKGPAINRGIL